jgi:AhpC/TSA family
VLVSTRDLSRVLFALAALVFLASSCEGNGNVANELAEGDHAPDFALPSAAGGRVALSDFEGKKPALLYFSMGPG